MPLPCWATSLFRVVYVNKGIQMRRAVWILAAGTVALAAPGSASAAPALAAPDVQFTASGPGAITATVHNKNTQKGTVCWAVDADSNATFGSGGADSYAGPGQTIRVSLLNLPAGPVHAVAYCAYHTPPLGSHDYTSSAPTPPATINVTAGGGGIPSLSSGM
jgi:hypothetical protein